MVERVYRTILMIGPPGAGKGTIGRALGQLPGYYFSSAGDVLRSVDPDSDRGREIGKYMRTGELVPDALVIETWRHSLDHAIVMHGFVPEEDLLLLDGIPRNVNQAKALKDIIKVEAVLHFHCGNESVLTDRIRGRRQAREDDAREAVISHRFDVYHNQTESLLEHYAKDLQVRVDAGAPPLEVLTQVAEHLRDRGLIVEKIPHPEPVTSESEG